MCNVVLLYQMEPPSTLSWLGSNWPFNSIKTISFKTPCTFCRRQNCRLYNIATSKWTCTKETRALKSPSPNKYSSMNFHFQLQWRKSTEAALFFPTQTLWSIFLVHLFDFSPFVSTIPDLHLGSRGSELIIFSAGAKSINSSSVHRAACWY